MTFNLPRTVTAVAAAAVIAAALTVLPGASEQVSANAQTAVTKIASQCAAQAWPNYDASCVRDAREPSGQARQVRIVR